jgi:monofunctional glycosyltransferase
LGRRGRRGPRGRRLRVLPWVAGAVLLGGGFVWFVLIPYPRGLQARNPERTELMEQRLREARAAGETLDLRHEWVPLERVSPNLVRAVLVAEDDRFRQHAGVDWLALAEEVGWTGGDTFSWRSTEDLRALTEALRYVWEHRDEIRGRSTLTQQLAKNLYFGTDRSFLRKGMEFIVAGRLERRLEKDRILELYLNLVEWGPGVFGAEAASREYFGRSAAELSLTQAAALAATLPHPLTSNPSRAPAQMRFRQGLILARLAPGAPEFPEPIPPPAWIPLPEPGTEPELEPSVPTPSDPGVDPAPSDPDAPGAGAG